MTETTVDPEALKRYSFNVWNFKQGEMVNSIVGVKPYEDFSNALEEALSQVSALGNR